MVAREENEAERAALLDPWVRARRPDLEPTLPQAELTVSRINRRSSVCVIMPTRFSPAITAKTIRRLAALHDPRAFDLLLVDDASDDYQAIIPQLENELALQLNYIVRRQSGGSSGTQNAGITAALAAGYETIVLADNDAVLQTPNGIPRLVEGLEKAELVFPANVERNGQPPHLPFHATLHYLAFRATTVRRMGNIEPFFFLSLDDVEFVMRALSLGLRVREMPEVKVSHPLRKIGLVSNRTAYFIVRNYCFLIARSPVAVSYKMRALAFLTAYLFTKLIHALQFRDLTVLLTLRKALRDFRARRLDPIVPQEQFRYFLSKEPRKPAKSFAKTANRILLAKTYRVVGAEGELLTYSLAIPSKSKSHSRQRALVRP